MHMPAPTEVPVPTEKSTANDSRLPSSKADAAPAFVQQNVAQKNVEIGGPKGPEPTRYGDWEKGGRCIDF
jgi:hypothetical protein